jgi:chloramphenicol-sensitive protein RarD
MLVLAGAVTALPLLFYAEGVKRVPLSRMGFLQYISPTSQLLLGVLVFGERLGGVRILAFGFILSALVVFAATRSKKPSPAR